MLLDSDRNRILHMVESARLAMSFVQARCRADLDTDLQLRFAVLHALEVLGEAAAHVSAAMRAAHPDIPWRLAVSMRNRLIHAYFDVNLDIVWRTATQALPDLVPKLEAILDSESPEGKHLR